MNRLILVAGSALVGLAIAEVSLRVVLCRSAGVTSFALVRERFLGNKLAIFQNVDPENRANALARGVQIGDHIRVNSLGFRGAEFPLKKPPGTYRIVTLGGSSVFGTGSSCDETTWPAHLERMANGTRRSERVQVVNGGVPGFVSTEVLHRFEEACLPLDPDVAVFCIVHNDVLSARVTRLAYDPRLEAPVRIDGVVDEILSHSAVWLQLQAIRTHAAKQERVALAIERVEGTPTTDEAPPRDGDRFIIWEGRRDEIHRSLAQERATGTTPYHVPEDLVRYRANLEQFVAAARAAGVVPVLAIEPLAFRLDEGGETYPEKSELLHFYFPDFMRFRETYAAYEQVVRDVAREGGVALVDAERDLPRIPAQWTDQVHTDDAGAQAMAALVRRVLDEAGLLPEAVD